MKVVVLGDIHLPFHSERAINKVLAEIKRIQPTHVVQIGDLYDQYSFSRFTRRNLETPESELERGRKAAINIWDSVRKYSRRSKCFQILGNHDVRLIKRVEEKLPEAQTLVKEKVMELYQFKGVETIEDDRDILEINGILFHHGYLSQPGAHMRYFGKSTVVGHSHTGGTVFEQRHGKTLFELNAGYLADENSEPLRYRPTKTSKWTLGYGLITSGPNGLQPQFIPIR